MSKVLAGVSNYRFDQGDSCTSFSKKYSGYHDLWCRDQFRYNKPAIDRICETISEYWDEKNVPIGSNSCFFIRDRIVVTMYYLMHAVSIVEAAKQFEISYKILRIEILIK